MDLDLRLVRYFTVVAEHLNFGRAATALHLAQPSLSRQIQRLEDQLGVRLFDRTPQGSRLTEAGQAFLPQAQELLHSARQARLTARAAAPPRAITIGYVGDLIVTPAVRELRRRHPDAQVSTRHLGWKDTHDLPERRVDALVARMPLPFLTDQLHVTNLYDEPRVLVISTSHRLAGKESVTLDDLAEEELIPCTSTATIWSAPRPLPDVSSAPAGPGADDSSSPTATPSPFCPPATGAAHYAETSPPSPLRGSTPARWCSPPAPATTTRWSTPSTRSPGPTSPGAPDRPRLAARPVTHGRRS